MEKNTGSAPNIESLMCGFNAVGIQPSKRWSDTNDVLRVLYNRDMFDDRPRIIKLNGLPEGYTELAGHLEVLDKNNILVVWSPFGYIKPGTKRWITAKTSKLFKLIKSKGSVIELPVEARNNYTAAQWVLEVAIDQNKKIDIETAKYLVSRQGLNLDLLDNSVLKLSTYQNKKEITSEDVDACILKKY